jgi:tetratricopeptide (TPR) repeat protein
LNRYRRTIVVLFAGMFLLSPALPVHALPLHGEKTVPSAKEDSILHSWVRYSVQGSSDLFGFPGDAEKVKREIHRLADRLRPAVAAGDRGPGVLDAFRRILLEEEGFSYDRVAGNPENFLIEGVLDRKRGNCLGLTLLWLSLAEELDLPLRGVYVPGHIFIRYAGDNASLNFEFSDGGAPWEDARYRRRFHLGTAGPYLRSLSPEETLGVFLKSLGAAYTRKGRNEEALALYAQGERLYPGLPDVPYNAGVSLQRLGRPDLAILKYRRAIALDPEMALARGNLGILLAMQGNYADAIAEGLRAVELQPWSAAAHGNLASTYCACGKYDEGIREFRKAAEIDPLSAPVRAGLTRALFATGAYPEAARECDLAFSLGYRFEPSMIEMLSRYR